jgi:MFS family permease
MTRGLNSRMPQFRHYGSGFSAWGKYLPAASLCCGSNSRSSLCLGLFLAMLDSSIVATSLFTIGVEFDALQQINWVALAYTLTYLSCAVLFARVSDVIGRRDSFLISFILFFAFSLGCGFSQSINQLIACRALQGLGGSGMPHDLCRQPNNN